MQTVFRYIPSARTIHHRGVPNRTLQAFVNNCNITHPALALVIIGKSCIYLRNARKFKKKVPKLSLSHVSKPQGRNCEQIIDFNLFYCLMDAYFTKYSKIVPITYICIRCLCRFSDIRKRFNMKMALLATWPTKPYMFPTSKPYRFFGITRFGILLFNFSFMIHRDQTILPVTWFQHVSNLHFAIIDTWGLLLNQKWVSTIWILPRVCSSKHAKFQFWAHLTWR